MVPAEAGPISFADIENQHDPVHLARGSSHVLHSGPSDRRRCYPWTVHRPNSFVEPTSISLEEFNRHHFWLNRNCTEWRRTIAFRNALTTHLKHNVISPACRIVPTLLLCYGRWTTVVAAATTLPYTRLHFEALKTPASVFSHLNQQPVAPVG